MKPAWSTETIVRNGTDIKVHVATLPEAVLNQFKGGKFDTLHIDGSRATRARFPNGNVEVFVEGGMQNDKSFVRAHHYLDPLGGDGDEYTGPIPTYINTSTPARLDHYSQFFQLGEGPEGGYIPGKTPAVSKFVPPTAFYAAKNPKAGGPPWSQVRSKRSILKKKNPPKNMLTFARVMTLCAFKYHPPPGLSFNDTHYAPRLQSWNTTRFQESGGNDPVVFMITPYQYAFWQFQLQDVDKSKNELLFGRGGFQEQRGCEQKCGAKAAESRNDALEFYVENVFEELDAANEWYLDTKTRKLYYISNSTATDGAAFDPESAQFVAPRLTQLIEIRGSQDVPVRNVSLEDVGITQAAVTYFEDYEARISGDYSFHRGAAVFVEGAVSPQVLRCNFTRTDGNALFFSNYVRYALVADSEFSFTGDNGITIIGTTQGIDGTDGNHPRNTTITRNILREIGMYQMQATPMWQSIACASTYTNNIVFNTPRAALNFNDGFGGANVAKSNLFFNCVRSTSDHGNINYYDRLPYITDMKNGPDGPLSVYPAESFTSENMLFSNYQSVWPSDHDDGSCQWTDENNYFVYAGFKNYLGNTLVSKGNAYVWPDSTLDKGVFRGFPYCAGVAGAQRDGLYLVSPVNNGTGRWYGPSGWGHGWYNNTCAMLHSNEAYQFTTCNLASDIDNKASPGRLQTGPHDKGMIGVPYLHSNKLYLPGSDIQIRCGNETWGIKDFQKLGYEKNTQILPPANIDMVLQWGRDLLGIPATVDDLSKIMI